MKYDPERHHRTSIRIKGYDYTSVGSYFITICTQDRACLFGEIVDSEMRLNDAGRMVQTVWDELPVFYAGVLTDQFIIMPNHIHGIVSLTETGTCASPDATAVSLPEVAHRAKTMTTKRYTDGVKQSGWPPYRERLWQRNYYEHVVRDEAALERFRDYIEGNPSRWVDDDENPAKTCVR